VRVEGLGTVDDVTRKEFVERVEILIGETGADVADSFVRLLGGIVAGEEVGAVFGGSFAFAVVGTNDDKV
jgi:hypothetical protein